MISVGCDNLKACINQLNKLIDEYEEIEINLFHQIKNGCTSWKDGNSMLFDDYIENEKSETSKFQSLLNNRRDVLSSIYNYYSSIGKTIKCNLDNKTKSIQLVNDCINYCDVAISNLRNVSYDTSSVENEINSVKNLLSNTSREISEYYNKIAQIERNITVNITGTIEIVVGNKNFERVHNNYNDKCIIHEEDLKKDIELLEYYSNEEVTSLSKIFDKFDEVVQAYQSNINTNKLNASINETNSISNSISDKRKLYADTLRETYEIYTTNAQDTLATLNRKMDEVDDNVTKIKY